jgi:hypothetical protein
MLKKPQKSPVLDPDLAAELYDDGDSLAGAMIAAQASGMEFSDYITRGGSPAPKKKRRRKVAPRD